MQARPQRRLQLMVLAAVASMASAGPVAPLSAPEGLNAWGVCGGEWALRDGVLAQSDTWVAESSYEQTGHLFLRQPVLGDGTVEFEFRVDPTSPGVGGAELLLRSTDSRTYLVLQFSTQAGGVLLARASRDAFWTDIARVYQVPMPRGQWHAVAVRLSGPEIAVTVNGKEVLQARDGTLAAGLVGLGSSQARVEFRGLRLEGQTADLQSPWQDLGGRTARPDSAVICADAGAGAYEAFPDVCRCANGDLLCVLYAGYTHISFPKKELPNGARICSVRSADDGRTWDPAQTVVDTPWDDRDPSITCLRDGTLLCAWFTYYGDFRAPEPGKPTRFKELWLASSTDHGQTWTEPRRVPVTEDLVWGTSSPIIELSDGALLWPVYREYQNPLRAWSAMLRSLDSGLTWTGPHWVDEANPDNDEPAVLELPDGRVLCLMRNNAGDSMWWSESRDRGLTWTPAAKTGFPGHAPYLFRTAEGVLLMGHRLPGTSLHWSLDEGRTWAGSLQLDPCIGAYPSLVARRDGSLLCVYYEEGDGSSIRGQRLRVTREGVSPLPWIRP